MVNKFNNINKTHNHLSPLNSHTHNNKTHNHLSPQTFKLTHTQITTYCLEMQVLAYATHTHTYRSTCVIEVYSYIYIYIYIRNEDDLGEPI